MECMLTCAIPMIHDNQGFGDAEEEDDAAEGSYDTPGWGSKGKDSCNHASANGKCREVAVMASGYCKYHRCPSCSGDKPQTSLYCPTCAAQPTAGDDDEGGDYDTPAWGSHGEGAART